jgi:ketosteroid isomerase-like protein
MPDPASVAQRYVEAMNAADIDRMMSLFAPHAVMRHMTGTYEGREAIRTFFIEIAFGNSARLERIVLSSQADMAWLEVEARSDVTPGCQRVVDVFRFGPGGLIEDLGVYSGNIVASA